MKGSIEATWFMFDRRCRADCRPCARAKGVEIKGQMGHRVFRLWSNGCRRPSAPVDPDQYPNQPTNHGSTPPFHPLTILQIRAVRSRSWSGNFFATGRASVPVDRVTVDDLPLSVDTRFLQLTSLRQLTYSTLRVWRSIRVFGAHRYVSRKTQ